MRCPIDCPSVIRFLTCTSVFLSSGAFIPGKTPSGFDRLKDLLGTWEGRDSHGNGVAATYRLTANETAIMDSLDIGASRDNMVTV